MIQKESSDWTSLPVLTEIVGEAPLEIPTLTEEVANQHKSPNINTPEIPPHNEVVEMSAEEIAALLAPQLEKELREKLRAQFEELWQETWMQTRASLPELIHAQLRAQLANTALAGSKVPAVDIITPNPAAASTKKSAASKAGAAKTNPKTSKNK